MKEQAWMGILEAGGTLPKEGGEMKGHAVKLLLSHFVHSTYISGTGSLSDVILRAVGQLAHQFSLTCLCSGTQKVISIWVFLLNSNRALEPSYISSYQVCWWVKFDISKTWEKKFHLQEHAADYILKGNYNTMFCSAVSPARLSMESRRRIWSQILKT